MAQNRAENSISDDKLPLLSEVVAEPSPLCHVHAPRSSSAVRFRQLPNGEHEHLLLGSLSEGKKTHRMSLSEVFTRWKLEQSSSSQLCFAPLRQQTSHLLASHQTNTLQAEAAVSGGVYVVASRMPLAVSASSVVHVARKVEPGKASAAEQQLYAIKVFRRLPRETAKKYRKRAIAEHCMAHLLNHANVVRTLDLVADESQECLCVAMELCAGGNLFDLIKAAGKLETGESDCFFKQLLSGVQYIHSMGVSHRNIKPENILLTSHGAVKIADFGCAECFRLAWENKARWSCSLQGTLPYIAPEEFAGHLFDPKAVDLWAVGIVYFAMRTAAWPWRIARIQDRLYCEYLKARRHEQCAQLERIHEVSICLLLDAALCLHFIAQASCSFHVCWRRLFVEQYCMPSSTLLLSAG